MNEIEVKKHNTAFQTKKIKTTAVSAKETKPQKEDKQTDLEDTEQKNGSASLSRMCTQSVMGSALVMDSMFNDKLDLVTLVKNLNEKVDRVIDGDLRSVEGMLMAQAHTLNVIFNNMMIKTAKTSFVAQVQVLSEIALKAQNQCRQTLSVLAELKNPKRTMFVKQQNLAINQQVNNKDPSTISKNSENLANELLIEAKQYEALELGKPTETVTVNTQMEAMAAIDRSENS
jgi:hypothetical protein